MLLSIFLKIVYNSRVRSNCLKSSFPMSKCLNSSILTLFFTPLTWESIQMIKNEWQDHKEIGWRRREDGFEGCRFYWCNKKYIRHAPFLRYFEKMLKSLISSILSLSFGFLIALKIEKLEFKSCIKLNISLCWSLCWLVSWSVCQNTY